MRVVASIVFAVALVNCSVGAVFAAPRPFHLPKRAVPASMGYPPGDGTLYSFGSGADANPEGGLVNVNGVLYGTTCEDAIFGSNGPGTVFAVNAGRTERVLHSFGSGTDGLCPVAGLVYVNGVFYGTTIYGGKYGRGTVFAITTAGAERVLHDFRGEPDDADGPWSSLIDLNGVLYGTTRAGGTYNGGTVFAITTTGLERVVYSLNGFGNSKDAQSSASSLVGENGVLFGTSQGGGASDDGTVFSVSADGTERVLYSFDGTDGEDPLAGLIDVNGVFYGTTYFGGKYGHGTVFAITTAGTENVLHSFGHGSDGASPWAGLIDVNGILYGTTSGGGKYGEGTVFAITTAGTERVVRDFGFNQKPLAALIDVNGVLYGTAFGGGKYGGGTIFFQSP